MTPGKLDIDIYQGATFRKQLIWKIDGVVVNLTGFTARMQIRLAVDSDVSLLELTTENGRIDITDIEGKIDLVISASDTELLDFSSAVYDLELVDGTEIFRLCQGSVTLHKEVTR